MPTSSIMPYAPLEWPQLAESRWYCVATAISYPRSIHRHAEELIARSLSAIRGQHLGRPESADALNCSSGSRQWLEGIDVAAHRVHAKRSGALHGLAARLDRLARFNAVVIRGRDLQPPCAAVEIIPGLGGPGRVPWPHRVDHRAVLGHEVVHRNDPCARRATVVVRG